jgi:hypothetical protein
MIKSIFNELYISNNKFIFYSYIFVIIVLIVLSIIIGYKEVKKNESKWFTLYNG